MKKEVFKKEYQVGLFVKKNVEVTLHEEEGNKNLVVSFNQQVSNRLMKKLVNKSVNDYMISQSKFLSKGLVA